MLYGLVWNRKELKITLDQKFFEFICCPTEILDITNLSTDFASRAKHKILGVSAVVSVSQLIINIDGY